MHPKTLVEVATELTRQVLRLKSPADAVVSAFFREHRGLGPRERHSLAETVYQILRRRPVLQNLAQSGSGDLHRRLVLLAWVGDDSFVQAGMTEPEIQWWKQCRSIDLSTLPERLRHNMPEWLAQRLQTEVGEGWLELAEALNQPAGLDLRVNAMKGKREDVLEQLAKAGMKVSATPWSPWGIRVEGKPSIQAQPLFKDGSVEVQDEGSQLLALVTGAKRGEMVTDFCAGAGGKTLALGAMMRNTGRLYAMDPSGHRLAALKPRLARSGLSNVYPIQIAHENDERVKRLKGKMDRVLVDAPCSGLGTLRRNPDLKWRQTPQAVAEMAAKQLSILQSASRLVKPGGRLVYSTCSLLREENEDVVLAFEASAQGAGFQRMDMLDALESLPSELARECVQDGVLRLWPHKHGVDGFFACAWLRSN